MKTLATIMILALVSFGILTPVIISYRDKRKLINEIKKRQKTIKINKHMDNNNITSARYILGNLETLQIKVVNIPEARVAIRVRNYTTYYEIEFEFGFNEKFTTVVMSFDSRYREDVLQELLEDLKRQIDEAIESQK